MRRQQVTEETVKSWAEEWVIGLILEKEPRGTRTAFIADKVNALLAERDAEIAMLRSALGVFAGNNWIGAELDQFGGVRSWQMRGSLPCPWEAAAEALKGGAVP